MPFPIKIPALKPTSLLTERVGDERPSCLLCFDFDGTLVDSEGSGSLNQDLMLYIEHLRSRGAQWVVNTGRTMFHAMEGLKGYGFPFMPDYLISQETELLQPGSMNRWVDLGDWNQRRKKAYQRVRRQGGEFFEEIRQFVKEETGSQYLTRNDDLDEIIAKDRQEMDLIVKRIDLESRARAFDEVGYQRNSIYLRFGHRDFSKGTTLAELTRMLGLGPDQVFAAGDNFNDLSMLSRDVAHAIACPANSEPEVIQKVLEGDGFVATSEHGEGMIEALGHFFFR